MEMSKSDIVKNYGIKNSAFESNKKENKKEVVRTTLSVNNALKRDLPQRTLSEQLLEVVIREFEKITM
jgi:hypothetical protein